MDASARAASAWGFRWAVEEHAQRGFLRVAHGLRAHGYPNELVEMARSAANDERDHAARCRALSIRFGGDDVLPDVGEADELAPRDMEPADRLLYECVARSCIAETESAATLAEMSGRAAPPVRDVVHRIARDEIQHARFGWAVLGYARAKRDVRFLSAHLPSMLETSGAPLFAAVGEEDDLFDLGVFSLATKRAVFVESMEAVIFPSFDELGLDTTAARAWLAAQRARL